MKIHIIKWRIERDHSVSLWMKDVFDQQHLLISSFVSFLNTAISKQQAGESQVKYNTGLTGWGAPKQPGTPEGSLQKRWRLLLKVKNYASNKAKKRAALMARSKKRAASSKSDKSNTSFQLWERTPRQDKDWVGFSRVGNETTFMEWVEAKPPALFESQGQARPSALKRAVCITGKKSSKIKVGAA